MLTWKTTCLFTQFLEALRGRCLKSKVACRSGSHVPPFIIGHQVTTWPGEIREYLRLLYPENYCDLTVGTGGLKIVNSGSLLLSGGSTRLLQRFKENVSSIHPTPILWEGLMSEICNVPTQCLLPSSC